MVFSVPAGSGEAPRGRSGGNIRKSGKGSPKIVTENLKLLFPAKKLLYYGKDNAIIWYDNESL